MGAVAQYLTYSSQESKFVSSNPATLNAFTVGDLLFKSQTLWRVLIRVVRRSRESLLLREKTPIVKILAPFFLFFNIYSICQHKLLIIYKYSLSS